MPTGKQGRIHHVKATSKSLNIPTPWVRPASQESVMVGKVERLRLRTYLQWQDTRYLRSSKPISIESDSELTANDSSCACTVWFSPYPDLLPSKFSHINCFVCNCFFSLFFQHRLASQISRWQRGLVYIGVICTSSRPATQRCISMDPERVPVLPHSEITPPVLGEDAPAPNLLSSSNPRTNVPIDTNNWVPFHDSSSSEKEVSARCHLCNHN